MDEKTLESADALTTSTIASGIEAARIKQKKPDGFDGTCQECGKEEVPAERVELGYYNCVTCQSNKEGRGRFFAR